MAQFEKVLDSVRLALTWASPAEIQALLKSLVKERIISEAFSKSLSPHRLTEGDAARRPGSDRMNSQGSTTNLHLDRGQVSQERKYGSSERRESAASDPNQTRSESSVDEPHCTRTWPQCHPPCDELNERLFSAPIVQDYKCNLDDEMTKLLRSTETMQEPVSDNERMVKGNFADEKEWLEQAARRIAVPLWQHWDRGQRMLLPLVPRMATGFATSENKETGTEPQCPFLNIEEETELAVACRTLDLYAESFLCTDEEITRFTEGLSTYESDGTTGWNEDLFDISGSVSCTSPVKASADTKNITDRREDLLNVCSVADRTTDTTEDLLWSMGDKQPDSAQCFSLSTPGGAQTTTHDISCYSHTDLSMTLGVIGNAENVSRTLHSTKLCCTDGKTKVDDKKADSHWGATMQEVDLDLLFGPDLGELPDDLSEFLSEDYLKTIDTDVLFGDPWLNGGDEQNNCIDAPMPTELPSHDGLQQVETEQRTDKTDNRRKSTRVPRLKRCTDENTPSRPKRRRAAGRPKSIEAEAGSTVTQGTDTGSEPSSAERVGFSTTPQRILHLHPSIQFITIPDAPGYHVVRTVNLSPPVIGLPLPNTAATPTYIFVPATSPPCKRQVPPLSPVDGAVVPVQMSSSPPGSLSDTASKAMSPPIASPLSPSNELSASKESALPQSPTVLDIPELVKDYIQEAKAHMSQTCQDMEAGLGLTSHYVDVQVSQRQILHSGKQSNKFLDKEMVIMGDTDRQKSLLGRSQIFEGLNGDKPKRYILLLGNTGMGKTTLIRKLCLDWSKDCIPQFDFVFLLDFKALTLKEAQYSLQTLLLNHSSFSSSCTDPDAVYDQILAAPKRVLIIFDGFDEVRDYETLLQTQEKDLVASLQKDSKAQNYTVKQLYSAVLQRVLLPGCTLLLSNRPRGAASQLLRRADCLLEVCGFTPIDVETYLSRYFTDPAHRESALDYLKKCSYLHLLCWNPGLCRLVCLVLDQAKSLEELPRTLTGLCHQVLRLKMKKDSGSTHSEAEDHTQISVPSVEETQSHISSSSQQKSHQRNTRSRSQGRTRSYTQRSRAKKRGKKDEEIKSDDGEADKIEERDLLLQLSSLAWEGVKASSSILPTGRTISAKLKAFGHRTGLFLFYHLRRREVVSTDEKEEKGGEKGEETGGGEKTENSDAHDDLILVWANRVLQSYLAGVHLSLSRTVTDRAFLQTLPFQPGPKGRRRLQREELELTQRFAVGLLFHNRTALQRLHSYTEKVFGDMVESKQALCTKHLESLSYGDLSSAQVLEACHYVYEASSTHSGDSRDSDNTPLVAHLAVHLPEVLTFHGVPLNPSDVFTVQNVLERGGSEGRRFCLDLEDSGIQISGLRALVGLNNINTYRACIADVITLWEQLEQTGEEGLLQGAVSKFKIHPLKATQVCHIEHLAKLVNIHVHKRLSDSSSQSESILAEGVPAVKELHKLEFELGPENGRLALPKLWELLPGLQNLQHLDLENSKIGDKGADILADALVSHCYLEILNLSQNCIGDQGVKRLATTLRDLPKLHCLSLYSNVISDEGAESLAAVLPHMSSLTELDVKYNKLTDVGAQSLGASLRSCRKMKTLRMWNQCIPYGVFERLQQQDNRIEWH